MALAARCPHCTALFRVVADQLKLRGGLVRCGACRQVFDAIGSLSYIDDQAVSLLPAMPAAPAPAGPEAVAPAAPSPAPAAPTPNPPAAPPAPRAQAKAQPHTQAPVPAPRPPAAPPARSANPMSPPTIMIELSDDLPLEPVEPGRVLADRVLGDRVLGDRILGDRVLGDRASRDRETGGRELRGPNTRPVPQAAPATAAAPSSPVPSPAAAVVPAAAAAAAPAPAVEPRIDAPESEPAPQVEDSEPATAEAAAADEPSTATEGASFLLAGEPPNQRLWRRIATVACGPLAVAAAFQGALALREPILESWPESRPLFVQACAWYGCSAAWPGRSDLLAVVGSELAAIPGTDAVELNASVRSRASFTMALPAIEVTLTDTQNRTVARKVFLPVDYLASSGEPSSRLDEGLAPNGDLAIRLVFEARGLNAAGFVVYPFYL